MKVLILVITFFLFSTHSYAEYSPLSIPKDICDESPSEIYCGTLKMDFISKELSKAERSYNQCIKNKIFKDELQKIASNIMKQTNLQIQNFCKTESYDHFSSEVIDSMLTAGLDINEPSNKLKIKGGGKAIFEELSEDEQSGITSPCVSELMVNQINQIRLMTFQMGCEL